MILLYPIIISSSTYLIVSILIFASLLWNNEIIVIGPKRPKYIVKHNNIFDIFDKTGVIFKLNPVVEKAENTSNNNWWNLKLLFSIINNKNVIKVIKIIEILNKTNDLVICDEGIFLLKILISVSLPRAKENKEKIIVKNVDTLIPPPVDIGPAPININIIKRNIDACDNVVISKVQKPPVRLLNDKNIACNQVKLLFNNLNNNVDVINKNKVIERIIFEWSDNFLNLLFWIISNITINPIPPQKIIKQVEMFNNILLE